MKYRVLLVAALLLLAGCNTGSTPGTPASTTAAPTTETTASSPSPTTTAVPTTIPADRQNPWRTETVTISVDTGPYSNESYLTAVRTAAAFWNNHTSASPHTVSFEVVPDAANPDIRVSYETRIKQCGGELAEDGWWWCTDIYTEGEVANGVAEIQLAGRYTDASTTRIVKQAFADLLGVDDQTSVPGLQPVESPQLRDPWPKPGPVIVAINQTVTPRNMTPLVADTIEYWETTGTKYANYSTEFVLRPDAENADVLVEFKRDIETCDRETGDFLGCASLLNRTRLASDQEVVRIETGYTDASTLATLKHEFGHLHGREHGQEPMPLMKSVGKAVRLPMPNATERPNPWMADSLLVYVNYDSFTGDREDVKEQVRHALEYYSEGADGYAPANLTLQLTENQSRADIQIRTGDLEGEAVSIGNPYGMNLDADSRVEYWTNQTIVLDDPSTDVIGWHVGSWLAVSITNEDDPAVFPPPFQDADYDDRRDWWRET